MSSVNRRDFLAAAATLASGLGATRMQADVTRARSYDEDLPNMLLFYLAGKLNALAAGTGTDPDARPVGSTEPFCTPEVPRDDSRLPGSEPARRGGGEGPRARRLSGGECHVSKPAELLGAGELIHIDSGQTAFSGAPAASSSPWHGPTRKYGDIDFGEHAYVDPQSVELRWFDYWLKGMDSGIQNEPPVKLFVMGRNEWRYESEYPLARTQYRKLYFHSDGRANSYRGNGRLSWDAPTTDSRPDHYSYNPDLPAPSAGGHRGPIDQRPVESRNDVLVYTSDFLDHEVEVTGPVKVVLYVASDAADTDFIAKLVDVFPDGRAINVAEGILRARYRESLSRPKLLKPGKIYPMEIDLIGTSNVFRVGAPNPRRRHQQPFSAV